MQLTNTDRIDVALERAIEGRQAGKPTFDLDGQVYKIPSSATVAGMRAAQRALNEGKETELARQFAVLLAV